MSHVEDLERELLTGLRAALEPQPNDRERIRRQLAAALALPDLSTSTPSNAPRSSLDGIGNLFASRVAQLSAVALVSGALGLAGGYRWGLGRHSGVSATAAMPPKHPDTIAPVANDRIGEVALPAQEAASSQESSRVKWGLPSAAATGAHTSPPTEDPLVEEMQLLRRAERAIRANNGLLALAMLRELDQRFPKGQLLEEREAARVMANCELNEPALAQELGSKYLERYPKSVYADRIRTLCQISPSPVTESQMPGN